MSDTQIEDPQGLQRSILRKLDIRILPFVTIIYMSGFLDKTNIGNAAIAGLLTDLHLDGSRFSMLLLVFFITDVLSELPSNMVVKKVKPNRWIGFLTGCWGLSMTLAGLTQTYGGLIAVRTIMGLIDGGLAPGMALYLSHMYKPHELQFRIGVMLSSATLAGLFGGFLAAAIVKLDGVAKLAGWRWIFILEGLFTLMFGFVTVLVLPANMASIRFFTEEEKKYVLKRLENDKHQPYLGDRDDTCKEKEEDVTAEFACQDMTMGPVEEEKFEWREIRRGVFDIQTWLTGLSLLGMGINTYSFLFFFPIIVSSLGYSGSEAQLRTGETEQSPIVESIDEIAVPPYILGAVLMITAAIVSDRTRLRIPFVLLFTPLTITGYVMAIEGKTALVRYGGCCFIAAGAYSSAPCIVTLIANNTSGHYKRATAMAIQIALGNSSGFIAPFIYTPEQAPKFIKGHTISLGFAVFTWVLSAANMLYCMWENKARKEGRRAGNIQKYLALRDAGLTKAPIGDRHPDFRFTL